MNGSLPFFMFFMKQMMVSWIGIDYERGLTMLKAYAETGRLPSKLDFIGNQQIAGFRYIARRTTCPISEIGPKMDDDWNRLCSRSQQILHRPNPKPHPSPPTFYPTLTILPFPTTIP